MWNFYRRIWRPGTPQQKELTLRPQHHINITVVAENNQSNINLSPSLSVSDRAVTNSLFTSSVLDLFLCIQLFSPGVRVKSELCLGVKWIISNSVPLKNFNLSSCWSSMCCSYSESIRCWGKTCFNDKWRNIMQLQLDTSWSRMQSCWSYKCYWFWFVLKKMFICNYYKM